MTGQPTGTVAFGHHTLHEVAMRDLISSTYRATSLGPPAQAVAVRVVSSALAATQSEIDGFLRANSRVSTTDHPHVLRVVDVGQDGQHAYVASVWRDGGPLADLLVPRRQLPVWMVVRMAGELAEALDALHANGIVHGTVGMHSVWIKNRRRGQRASNVALTGFGTSQLLGAALHNAGDADAAADLLFVAPEQVRDGRTDAASDQYALGCLLYTMLTGTPPFTAATNKGLFAEHLRAVAPPVSSLHPELDDAWDAVVGRALDKDPAARYADCRTLLREVSRCAPPRDDARQTIAASPDDARKTIAAWPDPRSPDSAGRTAHLPEARRPAPVRLRRRRLRPVLLGVLVALALVGLVLGGVPSPVDTDTIEWPTWLAGSDEQARSGDAVR